MWRAVLPLLCHFLCAGTRWDALADTVPVSPKSCSLECVQQGDCEYCLISREDVKATLNITLARQFGSCVPWPCGAFFGQQSLDVCQHYVHAPRNITITALDNQDLTHDIITVSWSPSPYGIAFLRGFQVSLQALGGTQMACQLFLLGRSRSLSASDAQQVYHSEPFMGLTLDTDYVVTIMALPVPERWDRFYQSKRFSTRTCPEKNGLAKCKRDWYPQHIEVQQKASDIVVTFNLAPESLGISHYFSSCYGGDLRIYQTIQPNVSRNKTHHSYHLLDLHTNINYTCEIAPDVVDAVRKTFFVQLQPKTEGPSTSVLKGPSLALLVPVGVVLAIAVLTITVLCRKKQRKRMLAQKETKPDLLEQYADKHLEEPVALTPKACPPRLLICYSSNDGPAHVKVVLQLAAFLQKHMSTQVSLDLWEALGLMEEGSVSWYCRRIEESDFVMVIGSPGLLKRPCEEQEEVGGEDTDDSWRLCVSSAAVAMIGEEIYLARAKGQDLSKYMTAIFEYSQEAHIPALLGLTSRYTLPRDLPLLFSHLHGVALQRPGVCLEVENISESGYAKLPAGAALQLAIQEATLQMSDQCQSEEGGSEDMQTQCGTMDRAALHRPYRSI